MVDDFYLDLVGAAPGEGTYLWAAGAGIVSHLGDAPDDTHVVPASVRDVGSGARCAPLLYPAIR